MSHLDVIFQDITTVILWIGLSACFVTAFCKIVLPVLYDQVDWLRHQRRKRLLIEQQCLLQQDENIKESDATEDPWNCDSFSRKMTEETSFTKDNRKRNKKENIPNGMKGELFREMDF
jgi:hypothetical protein